MTDALEKQAMPAIRRALRRHRPGGADLLTIGLGTTVAMWTVGYFGRMPGVVAPPALLAALMLGVLLAGGFLVGRSTGRGWAGGMITGVIIALLNLLIVGGTLAGGEEARVRPTALGWIPGTIAFTALITALAAHIGARFPLRRDRPPNWDGRLANVAVAATALLLVAGGLVTARGAGLAVPDWPGSFGYNMFLYPLARMTGNIYYEHAHRLYGALVGVTTIILAIHIWRTRTANWWRWLNAGTALLIVLMAGSVAAAIAVEGWTMPVVWAVALVSLAAAPLFWPPARRNPLAWLALIAIVAVVTQGVMGGMRVALASAGDGVEFVAAEHETLASIILRVAHGVMGQLFFALMVAIAALCSTAWRNHPIAVPAGGLRLDRGLTILLLGLLVVQLTLGAVLRHLGEALALHIALAMVVFLIAFISGLRVWGLYGERAPILKPIGFATVIVVIAQVGLGFAAWVVSSMTAAGEAPLAVRVIVTTVHQINGAALLALATLAVLYVHRLLRPLLAASHGEPEPPGPLVAVDRPESRKI